MSTLAQRERIAPRARPRRAAGGARSRPKTRLLGGGVLWILLFAALLAGVVAVNVAVLRLNLALDGSNQERTQLRADIAGIRAEVSSAAASARIDRAARDELGLVQADPDGMVYVTLPPR
jgi:cell division protein FtsL